MYVLILFICCRRNTLIVVVDIISSLEYSNRSYVFKCYNRVNKRKYLENNKYLKIIEIYRVNKI